MAKDTAKLPAVSMLRGVCRRIVPVAVMMLALQVPAAVAQDFVQEQGQQMQVPAPLPPQERAPGVSPALPVPGELSPQGNPGAVNVPADPVASSPQPLSPQLLSPQPISPAPQQDGVATGVPPTPLTDDALPQLPSLTPPEGEAMLHDLSPWGMYLQADIVVKAVMLGLVFASLVTWTIWLAKSLELFFAKRRARAGHTVLTRSQTLAEADAAFRAARRERGPVAQLVRGALDEASRSGNLPAEGIKERAAILLSRIEARAGRRMSVGTGLLATIGSTAPFVGLFGTVWGIMNSFIGIAKSNTTNLAVVAPGIAEALLATAIGLVAAIPAVIVYNMFARSISGYKALLGDASAEVLRHLSRDLDRGASADKRQNGPVAALRTAAAE